MAGRIAGFMEAMEPFVASPLLNPLIAAGVSYGLNRLGGEDNGEAMKSALGAAIGTGAGRYFGKEYIGRVMDKKAGAYNRAEEMLKTMPLKEVQAAFDREGRAYNAIQLGADLMGGMIGHQLGSWF